MSNGANRVLMFSAVSLLISGCSSIKVAGQNASIVQVTMSRQNLTTRISRWDRQRVDSQVLVKAPPPKKEEPKNAVISKKVVTKKTIIQPQAKARTAPSKPKKQYIPSGTKSYSIRPACRYVLRDLSRPQSSKFYCRPQE